MLTCTNTRLPVREDESQSTPALVEVHVGSGLPGFTVVGMPDSGVRELRERVRAAFLCSGIAWPLKRITVNVAPHGLSRLWYGARDGGSLALPIAVALAAAARGENAPAFVPPSQLRLDGQLRHQPTKLTDWTRTP